MTRTLNPVAFLIVVLAGCGDDPFILRWEENPTEAVIYALDREELNAPSAFDMLTRSQIVVEDPRTEGRWDFALDREGGHMVLLPPSTLGVTSRAAIVPLAGMSYEDVTQAPADTTLYISDVPVPVELGTIYVIRTHQQPGRFGRTCVYYGKVEPLEIDLEAGVLRFLQDTNPDCNRRSLIPPS